MAQILGYLPKEECDQFRAYAATLNLEASSLANLLLLRELAQQRLSELKAFRHDIPRNRCGKIVAHQSDDRTKDAFAAHAALYQLKPGPAASLVFRAELTERWLSRSLQIGDKIL